jgi:hypothetical protein
MKRGDKWGHRSLGAMEGTGIQGKVTFVEKMVCFLPYLRLEGREHSKRF